MRKIIYYILFLCSNLLLSQNYSRIDSIVSKYPKTFSNVEKLSNRIEKDFSNDEDKLRAAYFWISNNINYSLKESGVLSYSYSSESEKLYKKEKFSKKLASRALQKGIAVCEGYSHLFKNVAQEMGIPCSVVVGGAKSNIQRIGGRFNPSEHAWNLVTLNNKKYLIDVTWSSSDSRDNEIRDYYYLTEPLRFIISHYPNNKEDALCNITMSKKQFQDLPVYYKYEPNKRIVVQPQSGLLKQSSKIIYFEISIVDDAKDISIYNKGEVLPLRDYKITKDLITFSLDISIIERLTELDLYQGTSPVASFKVIP